MRCSRSNRNVSHLFPDDGLPLFPNDEGFLDLLFLLFFLSSAEEQSESEEPCFCVSSSSSSSDPHKSHLSQKSQRNPHSIFCVALKFRKNKMLEVSKSMSLSMSSLYYHYYFHFSHEKNSSITKAGKTDTGVMGYST